MELALRRTSWFQKRIRPLLRPAVARGRYGSGSHCLKINPYVANSIKPLVILRKILENNVGLAWSKAREYFFQHGIECGIVRLGVSQFFHQIVPLIGLTTSTPTILPPFVSIPTKIYSFTKKLHRSIRIQSTRSQFDCAG